jgi:hypothetical protein
VIAGSDHRLLRLDIEVIAALLAEVLFSHDACATTRATERFHGGFATRVDQRPSAATAKIEMVWIMKIAPGAEHNEPRIKLL